MSEGAKKKSKSGRKSGARDSSTPVISDPRFANIQSDPRYRLPSRRHTHTKLDKRFAHVLSDADFSKNAAVDRYGRKLRKDDTKKQLEKFYRLEDDEEDEGDEDEAVVPEGGEDDEKVQKELKKAEQRGYDPARDGGFEDSSSDEESSSESEGEDGAEAEGEDSQYPDQRGESIPMGEVTDRIAVVNLDWDNIRAEDLMAVFTSFAPTGEKILKVSVYPSEFGKERMEREEMEGPPKEIFVSEKEDKQEEFDSEDSESGGDDEDEDEDEDEKIKESMLKEDAGEEFNSAHLRRYQLERLRYYYAILKCSSKEAAKVIYDAVDGTEYLTSANFFDLRFVPDDTEFDDDTPRDECETLTDGYKPNDFVTDALQHSKVKLTWDADDTARKQAQAKAFRGSRQDIDENDLKAYLGSDSSDDEEDEEGVEIVDSTSGNIPASKVSKKEAERQRMRALLGLGSEPLKKSKDEGPTGDMEISFSAGLTGSKPRDSVFENEPEKEETVREKYIRKERERKQRRKAKNKAPAQEDEGEPQESGIQGEPEPEADLGFDDPFFTAPQHDKEAANALRKEEKKKKREQRAAEEAASAAQRAELELLMVDDKKAEIKHFDMNDIEKADKRARKSGKKGKKGPKKGEDEPEAARDDFQMDVKDPRFSNLFESHEFAIDPTNPRFKKTEGMKALLEEGRKRRRNVDDDDDGGEVERPVQKKKRGRGSAKKDDGGREDLKKLVDQVKKKAKKQ